jgi:chitinase
LTIGLDQWYEWRSRAEVRDGDEAVEPGSGEPSHHPLIYVNDIHRRTTGASRNAGERREGIFMKAVRYRALRRRLPAVTAVTALTLTGGLVVPAVIARANAQTNLVANPGFESGSISPWACDAGTGSVVGSPVHSGSHALALSPTGSDDAQCSQTITVQPNSAYTLSAWVEGNYAFLGDSGTGMSGTSTWASSPSWTQLSTNFNTGASTTSVTIWVHGWYGQGSVGVDDVALSGPAGSGGGSSTTGASSTTTVASTTTTTLATTTTTRATTTTTAPASTTTSTTAGGGGGGGGGCPLPAHVLEGYWQDFTNGAKPLTLAEVPTSYNVVAVAFGNATTTPGQVSFSIDSGLSSALGGYSQQQFISDVSALHSRCQKVVLSVGGQNGAITVDDSASAANFATSVYSIIQQYGFDGVDIDLENGVNATYMAQALEELSQDVGSKLIITMAPQTIDVQSTGDDYLALALNIKNILTIMNTQYYNSGSMNGCDGNVYSEGTENFLTALACIQLQSGLSAKQIGLGLPASPSAAGSGYVSPGVVNNALECLAARSSCGSYVPSSAWPAIGGAMTWSINWDASNGYAFADSVAPTLAHLP